MPRPDLTSVKGLDSEIVRVYNDKRFKWERAGIAKMLDQLGPSRQVVCHSCSPKMKSYPYERHMIEEITSVELKDHLIDVMAIGGIYREVFWFGICNNCKTVIWDVQFCNEPNFNMIEHPYQLYENDDRVIKV